MTDVFKALFEYFGGIDHYNKKLSEYRIADIPAGAVFYSESTDEFFELAFDKLELQSREKLPLQYRNRSLEIITDETIVQFNRTYFVYCRK